MVKRCLLFHEFSQVSQRQFVGPASCNIGPWVGGYQFADAFRHQEEAGKVLLARVYNVKDIGKCNEMLLLCKLEDCLRDCPSLIFKFLYYMFLPQCLLYLQGFFACPNAEPLLFTLAFPWSSRLFAKVYLKCLANQDPKSSTRVEKHFGGRGFGRSDITFLLICRFGFGCVQRCTIWRSTLSASSLLIQKLV